MRTRLIAAGLAALLPAGCIHAEDARNRAADPPERRARTAPGEPPETPPSVPTPPEARTAPVPEARPLEPPTKIAPTRTQPLLIGFYDDASFRWRPYRRAMLDAAQAAGATIIRATVYWDRVAPVRPRSPTAPLDPAYRLEDLDELGRSARRRGIELLLTIWGTPRWANGGRPRNRAPLRPADLGAFAQALAGRYSGRLPGFPRVRYFSIWNEPNRELFLAPQFDTRGRSVAPGVYARLARAAYGGIKRGNPRAVVAIGETAAYGRDRATTAPVQDSH
jgi:hypothetical protein